MSEDPFDHVSIYKSDDAVRLAKDDARWRPDDRKRQRDHAARQLARFAIPKDAWVVCRFVKADNAYGCPLHELLDPACGLNSSPMHGYGFKDDAPIATFTEEVAKDLAFHGYHSGHVVDVALPISAVTWRVLLCSTYDSSRVEMYRGDDLKAAQHAMGEARSAVERARGYLKAIIEGVARREP